MSIRRIRENKLPVQILLNRLHEGVTNAYRQIRIRHLTHGLLHGNEIQNIRMPVIDHQHQRSPAAAALLNESGGIAEQASPGDSSAG
ncbi:hypothetical protein D3C85_1182100 [compost metagenome]